MAATFPSRIAAAPAAWAERPSVSAKARATLWLTLAFWVSNFAFMTLASVLRGHDDLIAVNAMRALLVLFGLLLCLVLYRVLQKLSARSFKRRAIAAAFLAPVAAEIFAWASYFAYHAVDPDMPAGNWGDAIAFVASWTWFFLAWAGLTLALDYSFEVKEEQRRSAELQAFAHAAKLRALQNQVNPHFLFNSLNSMSAMLLEDRARDADRMIGRLAEFFRSTLAADPLADRRLEDEIALQMTYLEIEKVRFPDLEIVVDVSAEAAGALVPSLILQPIVENAVKYGVSGTAPPARIEIRAFVAGGRLCIEVVDDGKPPAKPAGGAGIGLRNVRERLAQRYDGEFALDARPLQPRGFLVRLELPRVTT